MSEIPIGVVTISDRASAGVYEDKGGPGIEAALAAILATPWRAVRRVIPDEKPRIETALRDLADIERCALILTTGGTGPSPRDVTPEATEAVCERLMPGFGEAMRPPRRRGGGGGGFPGGEARGPARREPHHQSAGQAGGDPHLPRRRIPG